MLVRLTELAVLADHQLQQAPEVQEAEGVLALAGLRLVPVISGQAEVGLWLEALSLLVGLQVEVVLPRLAGLARLLQTPATAVQGGKQGDHVLLAAEQAIRQHKAAAQAWGRSHQLQQT